MLVIFNTLTRQKETFKPIHPHKIGMYVCGVTVYDDCHLGHARIYTAVDVIIRYLRFIGYAVKHVRNITDIDDKIIKRANELNESFSSITQKYTTRMHEDFATLGLLAPDHEPCATEYIQPMIGLIEKMINHQHAYVARNGDVYFSVRSFNQYGALSHHDIEQLESGARVEISDAKNDPLDFVLWKLAKPSEPAWDSPWGKGRPGWHIECSAMSMDLLGEHFDIHAGGRDLIFPHHENEIAQSEASTKQKFVNVWMHAGFLQMEKEKMSKSLGNFITIQTALKEHAPQVLRYFLIANHYRSPLVYSKDALFHAKQSLIRLYTAIRFLPDVNPITGSIFEKQFKDAMNDDFNTPVALSVLFELAHEIQRVRDQDSQKAAAYAALLKQLSGVLGLLQSDPEEFFQAGNSDDTKKINALIEDRAKARSVKNWKEADRIRQELESMNVVIEDGASGTTWKYIK